MSMRPYHLFWNSDSGEPVVIKTGFSWGVFIFTFFYPFYKGFWRSGLMYLFGFFALAGLCEYFSLSETAITLLSMIYGVFMSVDYADSALKESLGKTNYSYLGTEFATGLEHAEFRALQKYMNHISSPVSETNSSY